MYRTSTKNSQNYLISTSSAQNIYKIYRKYRFQIRNNVSISKTKYREALDCLLIKIIITSIHPHATREVITTALYFEYGFTSPRERSTLSGSIGNLAVGPELRSDTLFVLILFWYPFHCSTVRWEVLDNTHSKNS